MIEDTYGNGFFIFTGMVKFVADANPLMFDVIYNVTKQVFYVNLID